LTFIFFNIPKTTNHQPVILVSTRSDGSKLPGDGARKRPGGLGGPMAVGTVGAAGRWAERQRVTGGYPTWRVDDQIR